MTTKFCSVLTYVEAKPMKKSHHSDHVIRRGHVSNLKLNISSSTRPIPPDLTESWCIVTGSHGLIHRVTWLFHYAVLWIHMRNLKCNVSLSTRPIPPGMRRRSDVSFWSHLGWDVTDHIETSSRRRYWYVNESDLFGTLSRRLTGT